MKKYGLGIVLLYLFFTAASAQTFSLVSIDTLTVGPMGGVPSCHANIINNSSAGFDVDVIRIVNDTAPNWQTSFCLDVCYPPNVDSARVFVPANFTQGFLLEIFSDTLADTTMVYMKFKNVSNPSNIFYQHYYGITDLEFGVQELSKNSIAVRIFPSPITSGNTFSFNISDKRNNSNSYSLLIQDIYGNNLTKINRLNSGVNTLTLSLPQGIYLYSLTLNNEIVKADKIVVLR